MAESAKVSPGDYVLLYSAGKKWLMRVSEAGQMHTHLGVIDLGRLVGLGYGSYVETNLAKRIWILQPVITDFIMKGERPTQILYPKEYGYLVARLGIGPGCTVVECGTGSGALTSYLAHIVRPTGRVYSYELRQEFLCVAVKNVERTGLSSFVSFKGADASENIDERDVDAVIVDVGEPCAVVENAWKALRGSGGFAASTPTFNQVERLVTKLHETGFVEVESIEIMLRRIDAKPGATRPSTRMIGHTTYLTFARKVEREEGERPQSL